jgi:hypothetical protein
MTTLPDDPYAAYHLAHVAHALEYARRESNPSAGPLAGYVILDGFECTDQALAAIPWTPGVHERILTDYGDIAVGWAPLGVVASAMRELDAKSAEALEAASGSDTSLWSIAYFGMTVTAARITYRDLVEADRAELKRRFAEAHAALRDDDGISITICGGSECDHDDEGPEMLDFADGPEPTWAASSCTKCRCDPNAPPW